MGSNPAIVVNEVRKTGLNLNIALLRATDFVSDPGLFSFKKIERVYKNNVVVNHNSCKSNTTNPCL